MFGIDEKTFFIIIFIFIIYFTPSFISYHRKHSKAVAIRVLNILAGWTFIGWVIAAVWAYTEDNRIKKIKK